MMIQARNVQKSFSGRDILRGVDLDVAEGELIGLIGKSGEGKSVLLKCLCGLYRPEAGDVQVAGVDLSKASRKEISALRAHFGYLFQSMALFDSLTVLENVALPLVEARRFPRAEIESRAREMLDRLEIANVADNYPSQISGGMQKRVALARTLVTRPKVVLFDEPTTGLDPLRKRAVLGLLSVTKKAFGFTAIIVSHDLPEMMSMCDRIVLLDGGVAAFSGTPAQARESSHPVLQAMLKAAEAPARGELEAEAANLV